MNDCGEHFLKLVLNCKLRLRSNLGPALKNVRPSEEENDDDALYNTLHYTRHAFRYQIFTVSHKKYKQSTIFLTDLLTYS